MQRAPAAVYRTFISLGGRGTSPVGATSGIRKSKEAMMTKDFKKGDKVGWDSSGGHSEGVVEKKVTSETKIKGHTAKATKEDPQYLVKSDKSGKEAIHKPEELKKR